MVEIDIDSKGIPCICVNKYTFYDKSHELGGEVLEGSLLDEIFDSVSDTWNFFKNKIRELI